MIPFLSLLALIAAVAFGWEWRRRRRRKALLESRLSPAERARVAELVPIIARLPAALNGPLEGKMRLFLHQTRMIGCDGLEVTDDMRLSIAAQACLLIVNTEAWYSSLRTILIYPSAFKARDESEDGLVVHEEQVRLGESWASGPVVLSWSHAEQGAIDDVDGHNVVLHEFAHQLDALSGKANGIPVLGSSRQMLKWASVFSRAYEEHRQGVMLDRGSVLDPYGAENYAEFFAVTIEVFFEKPARLKEELPEVYGQVSQLLNLDPAGW
ncbi:hypothetical protein C8N43_0738 [Litoreibacter ponti]|uniref:Mlc titration factor A n=1 Tax=Litoreibacter ponti TaxID=1510457 RepID=A0A2T6BJ49_9RHOB|nr:M90 family metallopeptidase [Litoreibacter ponti]PTX56087.1 hypothetical protein C8N43_0738 [Litoreibacter ponti]